MVDSELQVRSLSRTVHIRQDQSRTHMTSECSTARPVELQRSRVRRALERRHWLAGTQAPGPAVCQTQRRVGNPELNRKPPVGRGTSLLPTFPCVPPSPGRVRQLASRLVRWLLGQTLLSNEGRSCMLLGRNEDPNAQVMCMQNRFAYANQKMRERRRMNKVPSRARDRVGRVLVRGGNE